MTALKNFPFLNQLNQGDVNDAMNCVPTSLAAALRYLRGGSYSGAMLKDTVYGQSYTGATSASAYIPYCAQQGVILTNLKGNPTQLVSLIRNQLRKGHPVLATEQDPYANPALGWTHVICFYACDEPLGTLTAMDPFGAWADTRATTNWSRTFQFAEVWTLYKEGDSLMGGIPAAWLDDGKRLHPQNSPFNVVLGFREHILNSDWDPENWPLENEQHLSQLELSNPALGPGTRQRFRMSTLEWATARGVFQGWSGEELFALEKQIQSPQKPPPSPLSPSTRQVLSELLKALTPLAEGVSQ